MVVSQETNLESYFQSELQRALSETGVPANTQVEHYLVTLLVEQGVGPEPEQSLVELELAARAEPTPKRRCRALRHLGDHTLFTSGMFEERLRRRGVSARYYRDKGISAYAEAADMACAGHVPHESALRILARRYDDYVSALRQLREVTSLTTPQDAHSLLQTTPAWRGGVWGRRRGSALH